MERNNFCICLCFMFVAIFNVGHGAVLPSNWKMCKMNDPAVNDCVKEAIHVAVTSMKDGVPSLNLPSVNPLAIDQLHIEAGEGAVTIDQMFRKIELHGLLDSTVVDVKPDLAKMELYFKVFSKKFVAKAEYEFTGKVLMLPINGKGASVITFTNFVAEHLLKFEEVKKRGEKYLRVKDYKLTFTPEHIHMQFDNLFDGDKALSDNLNNMLNLNWEIVWMDIKEKYEEAYGQVYKHISNLIFSKVPYKNLFIQ